MAEQNRADSRQEQVYPKCCISAIIWNSPWTRKIVWNGGVKAYVHGNYLRKSPATLPPRPSASQTDLNISNYEAQVTATSLTVRRGPGTQHAKIGKLFRNKIVRITHHNGVWRRITWTGGQPAYIHGSYIKKLGTLIASAGELQCEFPTVRTFAKSAVESAKNFKKQFTQIIDNPSDSGTIAHCATLSWASGGFVTGAACRAVDRGLRVGLIGTGGGGIAIGGGWSGGIGVMASNSSIGKLAGWGLCAGGNISTPLGGGDGELCTGLKRNAPSNPRSCLWVSNGVLQGYLGASVGGEVDGSLTVTKTLIKDASLRDIYETVKGLVGSGSKIVRGFANAMINRLKDSLSPF